MWKIWKKEEKIDIMRNKKVGSRCEVLKDVRFDISIKCKLGAKLKKNSKCGN